MMKARKPWVQNPGDWVKCWLYSFLPCDIGKGFILSQPEFSDLYKGDQTSYSWVVVTIK